MVTEQATSHVIRSTVFKQNYAAKGGVFLLVLSSSIECFNCTFEENFALQGGIALVNNEASFTLRDSRITNNMAIECKQLFSKPL